MVNTPYTHEQEEAIGMIKKAVQSIHTTDTTLPAVCIEAVAGSGKTRCLLGMIRAIVDAHPTTRILYLSFNREVSANIKARVQGDYVEVSTMHALGLGMVIGAAPLDDYGNPTGVTVDPFKLFKTWRRLYPAYKAWPVAHSLGFRR
jgi:superfamily I DNA/RNA helicase